MKWLGNLYIWIVIFRPFIFNTTIDRVEGKIVILILDFIWLIIVSSHFSLIWNVYILCQNLLLCVSRACPEKREYHHAPGLWWKQNSFLHLASGRSPAYVMRFRLACMHRDILNFFSLLLLFAPVQYISKPVLKYHINEHRFWNFEYLGQ